METVYGWERNYANQKRKNNLKKTIKSIGNLFKLKREKKIKDRIIRDTSTLFEQEDDYYKLIRMGNFWNNN